MKKATLSLVALGITGAAIVGYVALNRTGGREIAAADLLPVETVALVELPNLTSSATRWRSTSLYQLTEEPEVKAFMERPLSLLPREAAITDIFAELKAMDARQLFVAVTSIEQNDPKLVGGIRYAGDAAAVRKLIDRVRNRVKQSAPSGRSDLEQFGRYEIESYTDQGVTVAGAYAEGWYFMGNDVALLKDTLERFEGKTLDGGTLASSENYSGAISQLPSTTELRFFLNYGILSGKLANVVAMTSGNLSPGQMEEMQKIKGIAFATTFDGELIRETLFCYAPGTAILPELTGATDPLFTAGTPFYAAFVPDFKQLNIPDPSADPAGVFNIFRRLESEGIDRVALGSALGPEAAIGFHLAMPEGGTINLPGNLLALEVKDRALVERAMQVVAEGWSRNEEDGVIYWTSPALNVPALPMTWSMALSDRYLLGGLETQGSRGAFLRGALTRAAEKDHALLTRSEPYLKALATVQKPGNSVAFIDSKEVFERVYVPLRAAAVLWSFSAPQHAAYIDLLKLPATETIIKHLHPSVVTSRQEKEGYRMESTGTVTVTQGLVGLTAAGVAAAKAAAPLLKGFGEGGSGSPFPLPGLPGGSSPASPGAPAPQTPEAEGTEETE